MNFHRTANHIGAGRVDFFMLFSPFHFNSSPFYLKLLKLKDMTREEDITMAADAASQYESPSFFEAFVAGAKWADAHPDIDVRTMAAWQSGYKEAVDKACEWLTRELCYTARGNNFFNNKTVTDEFVKQFKQAMKGGEE